MPVAEEIRAGCLGGTDIAAIIGLDENRDAFSVWCDKHGQLEKQPPTWRMKYGKLIERCVIEAYTDITGRETIFLDKTFRDPARPWIAYTPDAICAHEARGVDAKVVAWDQRPNWGDKPKDIPEKVQCQVHWYMACMDYPLWDVLAIVGGDEPKYYTFERDRELEDDLMAYAEHWWRHYIIGDERPPLGITDAASRYLKERFPRHRTQLRRAEPHEVILLEEYAQVRAEEEQVQAERVRLEHELKEAIGDGEGLTWSRGKFTWKNTRDATVTDWERLANRLMASYEAESKRVLVEEYSSVKPGPRRIYFHCKEAG